MNVHIYTICRNKKMDQLHLLRLCKELIELQSLSEEAQYLSLAMHFLLIFASEKQMCHPISTK